jgi:pimeloyl-ACP methyl ester carboxylesterase
MRLIKRLSRLCVAFTTVLVSFSAQAYTDLNFGATTFAGESVGAFDARLRTGSSYGNIGVIMMHGRYDYDPAMAASAYLEAGVVNPLQYSLNQAGFTTMSIQSPMFVDVADAANGYTQFSYYRNNESTLDQEVFNRVTASANYLYDNYGITQFVLVGHSLGSRYATASAAAWQNSLLDPYLHSSSMDLLGLVAAGMVTNGATSVSVPGTPSSLVGSNLSDINVLDTLGNLNHVNGLQVLDLQTTGDLTALSDALQRSLIGGAVASSYTQHTMNSPLGYPYRNVDGGTYSENDAHNFRNGYLAPGDYDAIYGAGSCTEIFCLDPAYFLSGDGATSIGSMDTYVSGWVTAAVPEPSTWLMFSVGLLSVFVAGRRRLS